MGPVDCNVWHFTAGFFNNWLTLFLWEPDNFGRASVFLFFQILGSLVILFLRQIFDLVLKRCISIIHTEYFWLVMGGLKERFYTWILKFVFTVGTHRLCCSWRFWWHWPYFIVKFLLSWCILFIHWSFLCQVSIDLICFSPLKFFWVLASSLVIVLKLFLIVG